MSRSRIAIIIASIVAGISALAGALSLAAVNSAPIDCIPANDCLIVPINGLNYQLKGESFRAYEDCLTGEKCQWVTINGTHYILKEDAYDAYQKLENVEAPLHLMGFESQFVEDGGVYLLGIDGYDTQEVDRLIADYRINVTNEKTTPVTISGQPTGQIYKSAFGLISKGELVRLTEEIDVRQLADKDISLARVASYVGDDGQTVTNPFQPTTEQDHQIISENKRFTESNASRIVSGNSGVTVVKQEDLIPAG